MKFFNDRADTEVTGHAILLGITILGISMLSVYSIPVIQDLQDISHVKNAEESLTVFDSRASKAALGEAPLQVTGINLGGGNVNVLPNSSEFKSYIIIKKVNKTTGTMESFSIPMGKIIYKLNDREVAYEGGGVWSKYTSGSVMLSPPEYHYNGQTLTLPVMNILTPASSGGQGTGNLQISLRDNITILYPTNESNRSNPVAGDKVYIVIYSEYSDAWADFLRSSEYMDVKENLASDGKNSVNVTLLVVPKGGLRPFVPPIQFRGINPVAPEPLDEFSFDFIDVGSSLQMDLRAPSSSSCQPSSQPTLDIQFKKESGAGTAGVRIRIYYSEGGKTEEFRTDTLVAIDSNENAYINLLNSSLNTTYRSSNPSWTWSIVYINPDSGPSLANVTQHYVSLMAQKYGSFFDLNAGTCPSDSPLYSPNQWPGYDSRYTLYYDSLGGITFLHVTRNDLIAGIN